jgi:hypothetical protein
MRHYGFTRTFFKKQDEDTLRDWARKLLIRNWLIQSNTTYWHTRELQNPNNIFQRMSKNDFVDYCYDMIDDIMENGIGDTSIFFWNDGGSNSGKEYLYDIIKEKDNKLLDDFIHSDCLDSFWEEEIKLYKLNTINIELLGSYTDEKTEHNDNKIINLWKKYKLINDKVELFDDDDISFSRIKKGAIKNRPGV